MEFNFNNIEGSKKYKQLLNTAKDLFFKYGLNRVSVEEVCEKANVSKMTFYKYFDNKLALMIFILQSFYDWGAQVFLEIWESDTNFGEKIKQAVRFKMQLTRELGDDMVLELMNSSYPEIKEFLKKQQDFWIQKLLTFFVEAQINGEIREDVKPEFILFVLTQVASWAENEHLLALYDDPRDLIREVLNFYINGLIIKEQIVSD